MHACSQESSVQIAPAKGDKLVVALAGNPNSGKTTLFNALTGLRQKVANYPGVTVEKKSGRCKLPGGAWATIVDLPGAYSLVSRSPDEQVAMEVVRGLRPDTPAPDAVIAVVDASNLQRNLYLVSQLIELGRPLVVALNMMDVAERRGLHVDPQALERELGVPVIPVVGHKRTGIPELKAALLHARVAPMPAWEHPQAMREELLLVGGALAILDSEGVCDSSASGPAASATKTGTGTVFGLACSPVAPVLRGEGRGEGSEAAPDAKTGTGTVFGSDSAGADTGGAGGTERRRPRSWSSPGAARRLDRYAAVAERLLIGDRAADMAPFAGREPVASLLKSAASRLEALGIEPMQADIEAHYRWIEQVAGRAAATVEELAAMGAAPPPSAVLDYETPRRRHLTEEVDAILIHRVWGLIIFAAIMALLFVTLFWAAQPIMDGIKHGVDFLGARAAARLGAGPLRDLLKDGVFAGVGAVVVFVPQIALLFLFLSILEDSGYLARAAFLMDRLLAKVGLHGKSFIPLLSSFACAIPGIMATRTIENRRDRLATILIAPFMSCSARLPVYTLLIGAFFAGCGAIAQAGVMFALYALGVLAAVLTAWIFKRSLLKGAPAAFILELPTYKAPQLSQVARQVWNNTGAFLTRAGTTIFCMSVVLWAMSYYPRLPASRAAEVRARATASAESATETGTGTVSSPVHSPAEKTGTGTVFSPGTDASSQGHGEQARRLNGAAEASSAAPALGLKPQAPSPKAAESPEPAGDQAVAAAQGEYSIAGRLGHAMEPALHPLGYDWKMGVGLVSAFAAREVFVSSMGILYAVGDTEEHGATDLARAMRADHYANGKPVWTPLVAVSLLVWFVLALQCMSTLAVVRRETGGWRWPLFMVLYMNLLAYAVSFAVFQVGGRLFHG